MTSVLSAGTKSAVVGRGRSGGLAEVRSATARHSVSASAGTRRRTVRTRVGMNDSLRSGRRVRRQAQGTDGGRGLPRPRLGTVLLRRFAQEVNAGKASLPV